MNSRTFGRRGLAPSAPTRVDFSRPREIGTARPGPHDAAPSFPAVDTAPEVEHDTSVERMLARIPFVTIALVMLLAMVFAIEKWLAFDLAGGLRLSHESLLALGGASRDLVIGGGDWWRVFLAPLLHNGTAHLGGNLFALAMVGWRLEPLIGRAWFGALFALSALAGIAGSLAGNQPHLVTVGASGAISGLIGALFAMSLAPRLDATHARAIRNTALFFGIPSLAPIVFGSAAGADGGTDWNAHLGGAICGVAVGVALLAAWRPDAERPGGGREAGALALLCLALSAGSVAIGAIDYSRYALSAGERIPAKLLPDKIEADTLARAEDLVRRWPKDPRGPFLVGVARIVRNDPAGAERALRSAIALVPDPERSPLASVVTAARPYLAIAVGMQNRLSEARVLAAPFCKPDRPSREPSNAATLRKIMVDTGLCPAPATNGTARPTPPRSPAAP